MFKKHFALSRGPCRSSCKAFTSDCDVEQTPVRFQPVVFPDLTETTSRNRSIFWTQILANRFAVLSKQC
jgi:hypothetical protein